MRSQSPIFATCLWVVATAMAPLLSACGSPPATPRCMEVCKREAFCAAESSGDAEYQFSRGECERTCGILERSEPGRARVTSHNDCVIRAAANCDAVLRCK